ncbi:hypothetical protein KC19_10G145700 [Ceratodon purpureus]|uniref:Tetratricopeptide repeat protein 30 n=1 Tax=Ceratodon purpureus TaxID=3225 RepID=A0A8T0GP62_CERPU|nr:hypothetical protein KC19_10G145700 [Ceratodon purpureus]
MELQSCKLVQNQCCPQETFGNLLLLYCKPSHGLYDLAADVMAENAELTFKHLTQKYVPVLMAMAKIWWDKEDYAQVERIFQQSTDLCSEHNLWKLNVAHTFFMQENKYKEAIHYYEPIVKEVGDNVLTVTAIVLANLCVSYIMTSRNEDAEDLMRKIEKEEERAHYDVSTLA